MVVVGPPSRGLELVTSLGGIESEMVGMGRSYWVFEMEASNTQVWVACLVEAWTMGVGWESADARLVGEGEVVDGVRVPSADREHMMSCRFVWPP